MLNIKNIVNLIRVRQYYKNIIIFLPLVFTLQLFSTELLIITIIGFVSLCLVSSGIYVRNDIKDLEIDKDHPLKKMRPLPSGEVSKSQAAIISASFTIVGLIIAFSLDWKFGIIVILLFLNTEIYSRWTTNIVFLDVFSIAGNFIIRTISGIILISAPISPWIILGVFFVALFLAFIKRRGEYETLKDISKDHRKTVQHYTPFSLDSGVIISGMMIMITYSIYSMTGPTGDWRLILTVPFVTFVIFRQLYLSSINDITAQTNEIFKDKQSFIAISIFVAFLLLLLYVVPSEVFESLL